MAQRAALPLGAATLHTWLPSCRSSCCAQSGPWGPGGLGCRERGSRLDPPGGPGCRERGSRLDPPGGQGCRERGSCPISACFASHTHVHTQWTLSSLEPRTGAFKADTESIRTSQSAPATCPHPDRSSGFQLASHVYSCPHPRPRNTARESDLATPMHPRIPRARFRVLAGGRPLPQGLPASPSPTPCCISVLWSLMPCGPFASVPRRETKAGRRFVDPHWERLDMWHSAYPSPAGELAAVQINLTISK